MIDKAQRQQRIREILGRNEIHNQEQLLDLLHAESIETTQATLSRDLRDIGAVRSAQGYVLQADRGGRDLDTRQLKGTLREALVAAERGGTLVVLRTHPGHGPAVAHEIERAALPQVIGTIAGHDTVFVAAGSPGQAGQVLKLFRKLGGR